MVSMFSCVKSILRATFLIKCAFTLGTTRHFFVYACGFALASLCACVHFFPPQAMSFEARSLTVPSIMWLGLLPSDLQRFGINIRYFLFPPPAP